MKHAKYLFIIVLTLFGCSKDSDYQDRTSSRKETNYNKAINPKDNCEMGWEYFQQTSSNENLKWHIENNIAHISGHRLIGGTDCYEEGYCYLISPALDLTEYETAHIAMSHVICYPDRNNIRDCHKVLVSTNYTNEATKAEWIATDFEPIGSRNKTFKEIHLDIPDNAIGNSCVHIALLYKATKSNASSWSIKSIAVKEGRAAKGNDEDIVEEKNEYTNEENNEYTDEENNKNASNEEEKSNEEEIYSPEGILTIAQLITAYDAGYRGTATITGYIVGTSKQGKASYTPIIGTEDVAETNILLADKCEETDGEKCIPLQLPKGEIRDRLNLKENPGNIGIRITVKGDINTLFKRAGIKNPTEFRVE